MAADPVAEEQFGPYAVYERLGVGGMATVHRALERGPDGFERMVALKRLLPHLAEDASFIKSFVREAKLASLLNHINIVQIYELGRVGTEYFISMEYIDGRDVRRILRHARKVSGAPPIHVTVALLIQLCEALDYAHGKVDENGEPLRLVHRDVSPSNVIVTSAGHLKVIDFGIAKAESSQLRTQTGRVKGKLAYMAPEAIAGGRDLDARSDLWAVGVILHELLTARPLFASKNEYQTLLKVQKGDIMPPSTFNQACPPELDAVVFKALARNPDDRFSSASEMRETLIEIKKQYSLQTGYRDVAAWLDWAFSLEQPGSAFTNQPTTGVSEVDPVEKQIRAKTPRPRNAEEDEAVAMVWGHGEGEGPATGPLLLDDVPDVSAPRRVPTDYDDIPGTIPSHGMHVDDNLLTLATPEQALVPPPASPDPAIARGTDPPVARGSNQMRSSSPTGSQPKPRPARPTGTINVPKPAGTGAPVGRTTSQGIPAQRGPAPSGPTQRPAGTSVPPTPRSPSPTVPPSTGAAPRATSPQPSTRTTAPQPTVAPTRTTGAQPTVPPARTTAPQPTVAPTRTTGAQPTAPTSTRQTGPAPAVRSTGTQPTSTRKTGPSPVVPGTRSSDRMPAQPTRSSDRMPAERASTQRGTGQATSIDIPQFDGPTNESLTTTTPEGFALPAIESPALRAEDLFNDADNNLAAADNAETVARPKERKPTEFDVTTNPIAAPLPEAIPSVPVVRFTKQVTAPPPVDGTRATGTLSAVTSASTREPTAVPVPPRTLTGQLRAPTVGDGRSTGAHRTKPLSQGMTIKRSSKRVYIFAALGAIVAGGAAAAITMMSSRHAAETTHVTAPTATIAATITTGTVKLVTEPADAVITIEGMPAHTGSPWTVDLPAGIHQIEIHRPGYKTWLTSIELSATEIQPVHVTLQPLSDASAAADATLTIATTPPGLDAIVDGNPLAEKTPTKVSVKVGPHTIAVRHNGAEVWHHAFTAEASSDYEFNPAFTADKLRERAERGTAPTTETGTPKPAPGGAAAPNAGTPSTSKDGATPAAPSAPAKAAAPPAGTSPGAQPSKSPTETTNGAPASAKPPTASSSSSSTGTTNGAPAESPKPPIDATKASGPTKTSGETKSATEARPSTEAAKSPAETPPAP